MTAGDYCNRDVVVCNKDESVREAVNLMRQHHVGDVIVVNQQNSSSVPVGIMTDRDIVIELVAANVDIDKVSVKDVMSSELVTVDVETPISEVIELMSTQGVRRVPVVNVDDSLVGILTVDDILEILAEELNGIVKLVSREISKEETLRS
jgi:CBS domain-containing protein